MQLPTSPKTVIGEEFASLIDALNTVQNQYTLCKARAKDREERFREENDRLALKVASLEARVSELQECIHVRLCWLAKSLTDLG